ncbi:hypothetical protein C3L50_13390 [Flavobacterium alvei]|uniref:OmpA-like domain-containing protein n=1 Tax=Flavobacterium alvei TaxID=2080416 RepID=A0A2S5A6N6_9FLAO|nr:OmpA family protein [Flavobacterium alvei]POY38251.1 hypothetical protein C3L50_13390 [Flavobacterium alvei]
MKQITMIIGVAISSSLLFSCGASKELKAENERLNSVVTANESTIKSLTKDAEDCNKLKAVLSEKIDNINKGLAERGTSMQKIQEKAQNAVTKLEEAGATVTYKDGLVYINYENDFFFSPNSSVIAAKGREALNTIAEVMRDNPGVTATIVGNTDSVVAKGTNDNWSLSTERANAVVRILHNTYNINPARLTAAGRAEYNPKASNTSEEGRKKNRRIEIIINPELSRIWELAK